ncbi:signal peptidase II [soil metagenome]
MSTIKLKNLHWLWLILIVLILDQATKWMISSHLTLDQSIYLLPFANFTLAHNTGAAFSFLQNAGGWQQWFFSGIAIIVSVGFLIWLLRLPPKHPGTAIALSLIIAGAIGNLLDRVMHGYVVDFIQLHAADWYWPAFNVADSAICIGGFLLVLFISESEKVVANRSA